MALGGLGDAEYMRGRMISAHNGFRRCVERLPLEVDIGGQDLARVRGALHALGIRKRQPSVARPQHGWASLTSGELAAVRVVAEGLTSREAAAQLYLSPDTINTHLRHAFAKLGIRSRVELARLVLSHPPG